MMTCRKVYEDIPFAHRQHRHDGHCALVHGHNWSFAFTFGCHKRDANGFVVDFGGLRFIRDEIARRFDHACVFSEDDPLREIIAGAAPEAFKMTVVPNCSCEGLCEHLFGLFDEQVRRFTGGRVFLVGVEVTEDHRNSAAFFPVHAREMAERADTALQPESIL